MTEKNPREQLGFVQAVTDLFRFLETDYDYRQVHADPTSVTYESRDMEIHVRHDLLSYAVDFDITGGSGSRKWTYSLPVIPPIKPRPLAV